MEQFTYRYDVRSVFDDFLTMSLCATSLNPLTGKSYDEDIYLSTIGKYADDDLRHEFPNLFALLIVEMEERATSDLGNDVLGEYFEQNFCRKNSGQFFTPWHVCQFMSKCICPENEDSIPHIPQRVLDPTCGSGRMLLASAENLGRSNEFYGIDIDHTCVKMTALNLFLNGIFHSEVLWADALLPNDFRMSYSISLLPFGIYRNDKPERSKLWHLMKNTFEANKMNVEELKKSVPDIKFRPEASDFPTGDVSQLKLF